MARYLKVNCFSCGRLFNKKYVTGEDQVIEDSTCWECQKLLSATAAKDLARRLLLPELKGSEKQVLWAEPVRIKVVNELLIRLHNFWDQPLQFKTAKRALTHVLSRPMLLNSGFWIKERYNEYGLKNYILKLATEEIRKVNPLQISASSMSEFGF
jgi:hypothetical protein